jgi:hypothetical protein
MKYIIKAYKELATEISNLTLNLKVNYNKCLITEGQDSLTQNQKEYILKTGSTTLYC